MSCIPNNLLNGSQTFKRVGASITINRIYKVVLSLSTILQLDAFFLLTLFGLWLDQVSVEFHLAYADEKDDEGSSGVLDAAQAIIYNLVCFHDSGQFESTRPPPADTLQAVIPWIALVRPRGRPV